MLCCTDLFDFSSNVDEKTKEDLQHSFSDNSRRLIQTFDSRTQSVYLSDHVKVDTSNQLDTAIHCNQSYLACDTVEGRVESGDSRLTCAACREKFKRPSALKRHMHKVHVESREYNFRCTICNRTIQTVGGLNSHFMRIHTGEETFKCDVCDEKFSHSSLLAIHKHIHRRDRPFGCSECDKKFTKPSSLNRHMLVHTAEEPYVCNCCDKKFINYGNFTAHMRRRTVEKSFICKVCDKTFPNAGKAHTPSHG